MPSLFSRRSRSMSTSRPTTPASSPAHQAAAQAFLASQPSHSNLSASAAAAALRTMSPTPRPVEQTQTKRMLDRQTSNSSLASASRGRSRGTVQRRPSSGSMTERTFRSPSPGQQTSQGAVVGAGRGAPPVPPVPQNYTEDLPRIPAKAHQRSASVDTPPRLSSIQPKRAAGRGQSVNTNITSASSAATTAARRSASHQQAPEMKRSDSQDSRNSINFSYPRGSRPNSPPPRSPLSSSNEVPPSPVATNGLSPAEVARIQNNLTQTAATPVKSKKKRVDPSAVEGSHLHSGTVGGKPKVTPLEPLSADYQTPVSEQPVKKPKKKAALSGQNTHFPDNPDSVIAPGAGSASTSDSDTGSEAALDRRAQRAAGVLLKQPSVVREDWEGEQVEEKSSPIEPVGPAATEQSSNIVSTPVQVKKTPPAANIARKIEEPSNLPKPSTGVHSAVTVPSPTIDPANKALLPTSVVQKSTRGVSSSPSRSTRFSDRLASDLAAGRKHEPLGRSISPAKSALKNSSAASDASPSDPNFPHRRGSSVTPSEASDVSVEGVSGRKKSARVSFEGVTDAKDSLADVRASKDAAKKGWSGSGRAKMSSSSLSADEEVEEGMKPRPALPSFGSVRRNERSNSPPRAKPGEKSAVTTQTPSSSETSSIADPPTMDTSISSDHALGGFLTRESQKNATTVYTQKQSESLSATAKSAEGTGYESDSESAYSDDEQPFKATKTASQELSKTVGDDKTSTAYSEEIPVISVQPATPGLDDLTGKSHWAFDVPGGFPASGASSDVSLSEAGEKSTSAKPSTDAASSAMSSVQDYSQPAEREIPMNSLSPIVEEDSDNDSVYSDAAEEIEGDGFGSINAIIESPISSPPQQRILAVTENPLVKDDQDRPDEVERTASWDDAQAHWSGLAQRSRDVKSQTPEQAPAPVQSTVKAADQPPVAAKKTAAQSLTPATTAAPKPAQAPVRKTQPKPVTTPQTRTQPQPQTQPPPSTVVATKRISPPKAQGHLRTSMRGEPEPVPMQPKQRPLSYTGPSSPPRTAVQKKTTPPAASSQPNLGRFSNDSDSDSSFKKARRAKRPADGQYTMRRSMRGGPAESARQTAAANQTAGRPQSPPVGNRPTSPMGMKTLRTTMRGSVDLGSPTLRPQVEQKRSSSLFSRNRTAKSPTRPASAVMALPTKVKSRITDSDDEDAPRPSRFKSRFGDSSDEDEPDVLRPVRGIPRRGDDGDSTDLADSSDEEARKSKSAAPKKLTIVPPPPAQEIASPPLSPTTAKKRGLWGRLRGKKKEDDIGPNASNTILQRQEAKEETATQKEESKDAKNLGFNSVAERDALIEQTRLKLEGAKQRPQSPVARPQSPIARPQSPSGKLLRRMTPQRVFSDSFMPPRIPAAVEERPQTSDGVDEITRPGPGSRQPTSEQVNGDGAVYGKSGKKKKFGRLRKVFGLTD